MGCLVIRSTIPSSPYSWSFCVLNTEYYLSIHSKEYWSKIMYARYLQVNVCVGFSVCWGSKPVVALLSDHVSVCPHHPPMSTRAVLRACAFTVCYHTYPRSVAPPPLSALVSGIWIDAQRQSHRARRSPVVKLR